MQLIPEAKNWWKLYSVWGLSFIASIQSVLITFPTEWLEKTVVAAVTWKDLGIYLTVAAAVITAIGRLIPQENV